MPAPATSTGELVIEIHRRVSVPAVPVLRQCCWCQREQTLRNSEECGDSVRIRQPVPTFFKYLSETRISRDRLLISAASRSGWCCTPWCGPRLLAGGQPNHGFWFLRLRSRSSSTSRGRRRPSCCTSASALGCPAIACRPILDHAGVGADGVAGTVLLAGVSEILAVLQSSVVHLDDRVLIARIILRPAREARQIVVTENDHIDAGGGRDFVDVGHALKSLDHDDDQHVVIN